METPSWQRSNPRKAPVAVPDRRVTVLGLDVDTRYIGAAITQDGVVFATTAVRLRGRTFEERLGALVQVMQGTHAQALLPGGITEWPDLIAFEDRNVARNQRTNNRLNEMVGALKALFIAGGYAGPFVEVNAARKLAVIGLHTRYGREMLKQLTVHRVGLMCQVQGLPAPSTDHAADAVLVSRAAFMDARLGRAGLGRAV